MNNYFYKQYLSAGSSYVEMHLANPFDELRNKYALCDKCPLSNKDYPPCLGRGEENADLLIIGPGPSEYEHKFRLIFSNKFNKRIFNIVSCIETLLDRKIKVYMTNVICCPLTGDNDLMGCSERCKERLSTEVHITNPKVILILGKDTANVLLPDSREWTDFGEQRGEEKLLFFNNTAYPVVATYSLKELYYMEDKIKPLIGNDLKKVMKILNDQRKVV
ncbi:hypothetical protein M0R04_05645 [Candidatus Dojkabacteria bacterium]|jgi:uracil-DNA glycosylase family 4|nr:hypothetical protein [Candidatus Dojkabacteria bacterium]